MQIIISEKAIAGEGIASILAGKKVPISKRDNAQLLEFKKGSDDFVLIPLRGHIVDVDFPKQYSNWLGTDLKQLTVTQIDYVPTERAIASLLKKTAPEADSVIVATDADREGESIGVEALRILQQGNPKISVSRAYFSAITKKDIEEAFSKLASVDYNFADSADARREIDLIWGAVLTRFLSLISGRLGKEFLSVGRVQTPVLALIVDREKERLAFKQQKYWVLAAIFEKGRQQFEAEHKKGKFWEKSEAETAFGKKNTFGTVTKVESSERKLAKPVPFNTTEFLRAATVLGFTAGEAMQHAETLYQMGLASYPRTDNSTYPATLNLKEILNELLKVQDFAPLVEKIFFLGALNPSRGKETKDHPPIHPVAAASKIKLSERQWRVYELICRRFFATLSEDAITLNQRVEIEMNKEPFIAHGQLIKKLGWKEFYPYSTLKEVHLPKLEKGDEVKLVKLDILEKETQPPARYSQSALIKLMEELGLGTKCLSGNTAVKVFNSPEPKNIFMEEIFSRSQKTGLTDCSAEIRKNEKFECIGVSVDGRVERQAFALASRRETSPKKEQMKRVLFSDGSFVDATQEHPFYCGSNGKARFRPVFALSSGDHVIALHDNSCQVSNGSFPFGEFLQLCNKKTYLFAAGLSEEIKRIRLSKGVSQAEFAKLLHCSQGDYSCYESGKRPIPLWVVKQTALVPKSISSQNEKQQVSNIFPIEKNAPLARILAKLLGDGSLDREKAKRENCFDFRYTNTNPDLIAEMVRDTEQVFKVRPKVIYSKGSRMAVMTVRLPAVAGRIISVLFPEVLEKKIWKGLPRELFPDFIGAFFDDEGHVTKKETKLFISNTNHRNLLEIQKMLCSLGIESRMDARQHKLHIQRRQSLFNFLEKIPIASLKKKQRLMDILSSHYKYGYKNKPLFLFEKKLLGSAAKEPKTTAELSEVMGVSRNAVVRHIRKLRKEGKIKKIVEGNNKDFQRTNRYVSLVDIPNSAYALLGEKVIRQKLVTKTILAIEDAKLPRFVFDITNSLESPAFVLANNVVVHNSTRHEIIQKLYARRYIAGLKAIEPNKIAFAVIDSLEKHCKKVTEPEMTADLEKEMDEIAAGKKQKTAIVQDSRTLLLDVLETLLPEKNTIGAELRKALTEDSIVGKCTNPNCDGQLLIRRGKTGKRFLGCTKYPACTTSYPLPQLGKIVVLNKECPECKAPMIRVENKRSRFEMCINHNCKTKEEWKKKREEAAAVVQQQKPAAEKQVASAPEKKTVEEKKVATKPKRLTRKKKE